MIRLPALILLAALSATFPACAGDDERGFVSLFNGKDLDGWKVQLRPGQDSPFKVVDNAVDVHGRGGILLTTTTFANFEARIEFRFVEKASDSGVFFRVASGKPGYQVQTKPYASIKGLGEVRSSNRNETFERTHDIDLVTKVMKPVGEWQSYRIIVRGEDAEVWLNGARVCTVHGLQHTGAGSLGLQSEKGHSQYRNIRVRELTAKGRP